MPMVHGTEFTTAELKAKFPENYDIISSGAARCWILRKHRVIKQQKKSDRTVREQTMCNVFETRSDIAERVHIDMLKI